jgi:hypothetical protein
MKKGFENILEGAMANLKANETSIVDKIVINEELRSLIPPLSDEEIHQLEENILKEGVRDPLVIWPSGDSYILVDGHNRFSICRKHHLEFPFKKIDFRDEAEARDWMVKNQLGRRNLSQEKQSYLRGLRYNQEKQQGKRVDLTSTQNESKLETEQTADRLAEEYNVSRNTIKRDAQFAAGIELIGKENPEIKKRILQGKAKLKRQDIQEVGQNKKSVNDLLQSSPREVKGKRSNVTAELIAEIAFSFISKETRTLEEVTISLSPNKPIKPLELFLKWKESNY